MTQKVTKTTTILNFYFKKKGEPYKRRDSSIEIFNKRLEATVAELAHFIDGGELRQPPYDPRYGDCDREPHLGFLTITRRHRKVQKVAHYEGLDFRSPKIGTIYLHSFWDQNTWVTVGALYTGDGPHSRKEFFSGHVRLTPRRSKTVKRTDVEIISNWSSMRPYWEWVGKRLLATFKQRRKGGPEGTPLEDKVEIVLGWREKAGRMTQERYCGMKGITARTLRTWEKELVEGGHIPKQ